MIPSRLKHESRTSMSQLLVERSDHHPSSTGSSSPLPWESPNTSRVRARSYMNPTTSFIAKVSRSGSSGDGLHLGLSSGEALPCTTPSSSPPSPFYAITPLLPTPNTSIPGSSNQSESRSNRSGLQTPPPKSTRVRVFGCPGNSVSEPCSRSTPIANPEVVTTLKDSFARPAHHHTGCLKDQTEAAKPASPHLASQPTPLKGGLNPESVSYTQQHERPQLAVQAFTVTSENQTDQGLHRRRSSSIILASVPFHLPLPCSSASLWPLCFTSHSVHSCMNHYCPRGESDFSLIPYCDPCLAHLGCSEEYSITMSKL